MRNNTPGLVIALLMLVYLPFESTAQNFTTLHTFDGADGGNSAAALIVVSNRLYGTTSEFYGSKAGTVFGMNVDGLDFRTLHHFSPFSNDPDSAQYICQ